MTDRAGRWGLRVLALVGAIVVWWFVSVETRERVSEKVVDASLSYNSSPGLILLDPLQTVKVRLRGPERRIRAIRPDLEGPVLLFCRTGARSTRLWELSFVI